MLRLSLTGCALFLSMITLIAAEAVKDEGTFTDGANAPPSAKIQGEYEGEVTVEGSPMKVGAQVIAQGNNTYRVRILYGGLPGTSDSTKQRIVEAKGETKDGQVLLTAKDFTGRIADGVLTGKESGQADLRLKRVERKSPTLGEKAPAGAKVLFDGSSKDEWMGGELSADKWLVVVPGKGNLKSKAKFKDFTLHMEFRLPYMPAARGQGRANSGVYLQDRYELQILDSFGLKGMNNECGGFYQQAAPAVNMCFPPLQWQTYDIDFTAARFENGMKVKNAVVTVKHNGVVIHDKLELTKATPGGQKEADTPGPLQFQDHGNPLAFRNVWVVAK